MLKLTNFDPPCFVALSDLDDTGGRRDDNSNGRNYSKFWERYRFILLTVASISLILFFLKLTLGIIFLHNAGNTSDYNELEIRVDRSIEQENFPLDRAPLSKAPSKTGVIDESLSIQSELAGQRSIKNVFVPVITGLDAQARSKRRISRERRDCGISAERCKELLETTQNYLEALRDKPTGDDITSASSDILKCLRCRENANSNRTGMKNAEADDESYALRSDSPRDRDERNYSGDSIESEQTLLQLLNSEEADSGSYSSPYIAVNSTRDRGVNRTEDVTTRAETDSITSEDTAGASSTDSYEIAQSAENTRSDETWRANKDDDDYVQYDINDNLITDRATSKVTAMPTETPANSTESRETGTRNYDILVDTTARTGIVENTNMTGINDGDVQAYSSFGGRSENQSAVNENESRTNQTTGYRSADDKLTSGDHSRRNTKQAVPNYGGTAESSKAYQQMHLTPSVSWMMPHPVCFYGYPGQLMKQSDKQPSSGSTSQTGFTGPFGQQYHGNPYQGYQGYQSPSYSASPNYVQLQAQSVQLTPTPRLNYAGNLERMQSTGAGIGPIGPSNTPIFSLNQSPISAPPQTPYFCTYISMPTIRFPPISGTSISRASSNDASSNDALSKSFMKNWGQNPVGRKSCLYYSRKCANEDYCVPVVQWCDGHVDCTDVSDETICSCRDRISRNRLCDGYLDCPHGEDEVGCLDCPQDYFSCDEWDYRNDRKKCVPLSQRCDGIEQCRNGKDESDCNVLSASYIDGKSKFTISYSEGYLHTNIKGQWYPVCSGGIQLARHACQSENGLPLLRMPKIVERFIGSENFQGPYVKEYDGRIEFVASCFDLIIFVKCPQLTCGTTVLSRPDPLTLPTVERIRKRDAEEQATSNFTDDYLETLRLSKRKYLTTEVNNDEEQRNDTLVGSQLRIVGGSASQPKAWPFVVGIYRNGEFHCGGTILSEYWILTAAHCMNNLTAHYYEVQAGLHRRFSFSPMVQLRRVERIIVYPDFKNLTMTNDIAIIMVDEPFYFNRWVRQICLPEQYTAGSEWMLDPTSQPTCVVIGWGAMTEDGQNPDQLREVEIPILPTCNHFYDRNDATFCAGELTNNRDACQGDSGGPLMCRNPKLPSQWYVAGIISHGDGCGRPGEPGVYTKVSYFVNWIRKIIENFQISYTGEMKNMLSSCPTFSCRSGKCLPIEKRCDRYTDCLDAEDELDCVPPIIYNKSAYSNYTNEYNNLYEESDSESSSDSAESNFRKEWIDEAIEGTVKNQTSNAETIYDRRILETDNDKNSFIWTSIDETTTPSSVRLTFTCTSVIQTITIDKRCDKRVDCEDATDEEDCTCRDFLSNLQPSAICDRHVDCDDGTDEDDCGVCKEDEFHCVRSGTCIPSARKCDGNFDCALKEDEIDCFALTDGDCVDLDNDNRPALNTEGLFSRYTNREWRIVCLGSTIIGNKTTVSTVGRRICEKLGFANTRSVDVVTVNRKVLETKSRRRRNDAATGSPSSRTAASRGDGTCATLRVACRPVLSSGVDVHLLVDPRTGSRTYLWPWLAAIFVDGRYRCTALLLESNWLLSSSRCTKDIRLSVNYTTALLGRSRGYLYVDGPHQQISVVDGIRNVSHSNVSLLHLKTAANLTHYVLPLFLENKFYPPKKQDLCVAVGTDEEYSTQSVFLKSVSQNCDKCYRCFVETSRRKCSTDNTTSSDWSGIIFCRSHKKWYPAAVFHENNGLCSFQSRRNLTGIDYIHAYLMQALEEKPKRKTEPRCDGVRCNLGQCIPREQICDGVTDCRDGADEKTEMCDRMNRINNADRKCTRSQLRCENGECISKNAFCDGKVDCTDGTDEPIKCSCAEYLKLTAPGRLCDGVRHCLDKTDESPEMCQCTETSFKCNTENGNATCVSQDFVCDDENDCPNGEDEQQCRMLRAVAQDRPGTGEIMQRSYGVWYSRCSSTPVTSQREARAACQAMGFKNGTVGRIENQISNLPTVVSRDDFYMFRLNAETWITMRDDKPLVTLVEPREPCYRLFVDCTSSNTV